MTLKLKRTPGLYLIGFMGSGKTTVGRVLADELGWSFADIDAEIERQHSRSIRDIFDVHGEQHFRQIESEVICSLVRKVQSGCPHIISTGGGAFAQLRNWEIVENNGVTVWLDCSFETVEARLGTNDPTRPLSLDRERMRQLYEARRPLYARADFHVNSDAADPAEVLRRLLSLPIF